MNVRAVGVSVLLAASIVLGGCSLVPSSTPTSEPAPTADAAPTPSAPQAPIEPLEVNDAALELKGKLEGALTQLAVTSKSPNREQMLQAMLDAGAVRDSVELSIDITPTGLAVDAIEAAAPVAGDCVIGQVRDGNVAVTILPVLASGRCFVGDVT